MGNRFVTPGLSGKATHGTRDLNIRKTGTGRRPSEVELTAEPVDTKSPKSSESYSGPQRGAAKKQDDPKSYGDATNAGFKAKGFDESPEAKSREDAEGRSASIVHRSLWDEENEASGRTKVSSETLQESSGTEVRTCFLHLWIQYIRPRRLNARMLLVVRRT